MDSDKIQWLRVTPFLLMHLAVFTAFLTGVSTTAIVVAVTLYLLRMFGITAFYHRYFSHRAFKTSRVVQFLGACLGNSAIQRGPLWWAAHHRKHHMHSDSDLDVHSPHQHGFWWSHVGWFMTKKNYRSDHKAIKDFAAFPELRFLDKFDWFVPLCLFCSLFLLGEYFQSAGFATNGWQLVVWGGVISTVCLYHMTFAINSLAHLLGTQDFKVRDHSRNNWLLSLFTLGEGWHNNHHKFPASARSGLRWWQIDITYYVLLVLRMLRIVHSFQNTPNAAAQTRGRLPANS